MTKTINAIKKTVATVNLKNSTEKRKKMNFFPMSQFICSLVKQLIQ